MTLDRLESHLDRVLAGKTGARSDFSQTHRRLETLMKKAGFPTHREFREQVTGGGSAKYVNGINQRVVDRDPAVGWLNGEIWAAYVAFTLEDQTLSTLNEGRQARARAMGFYQRLR